MNANHFIEQISDMKSLIEVILQKEPATRDDNKLLLLKVWAHQNPQLRSELFSFRDFANGFLAGNYANIESVTRLSRLLQREKPELRGHKFEERQKIEATTRQKINLI